MSETGRGGKRVRAARWTAIEARAVIEEWKTSGQSAVAFAQERGISATRLSYWSKQLAEEMVEATPRFVSVAVPSARDATTGATMEIEFGGVIMRVREDIDARTIVQLVTALHGRGCDRC